MPDIFTVPKINYWQAMGLLVLSRVFFGGLFGRVREPGFKHDGRYTHLHQKWQAMNPEERDAFLASRFKHFHHYKTAGGFTKETDQE